MHCVSIHHIIPHSEYVTIPMWWICYFIYTNGCRARRQICLWVMKHLKRYSKHASTRKSIKLTLKKYWSQWWWNTNDSALCRWILNISIIFYTTLHISVHTKCDAAHTPHLCRENAEMYLFWQIKFFILKWKIVKCFSRAYLTISINSSIFWRCQFPVDCHWIIVWHIEQPQ